MTFSDLLLSLFHYYLASVRYKNVHQLFIVVAGFEILTIVLRKFYFMGGNAIQSDGSWYMFRKNMMPPSSGYKNKPGGN